MPFSKLTQSLGGKAPASAKQKFVARQTIGEKKPWLKSTGAKTALGKARSAQNAFKASHRWKLHSLDPQYQSKLQLIEQAIECFAALQEEFGCEFPNGYFRIIVNQASKSGRDGLEQWRSIALRITCESSYQYLGVKGQPMPDYVAVQQRLIQERHDAAQIEVRRVQEFLRLIESSPVQKAIEVKAIGAS